MRNVVVAFVSVELQRPASDVTHGIRRSFLAAYSGESCEDFGFLAYFAEECCGCDVGDVVRDLEFTPCSGSFSMNGSDIC
jgi:hypothetical protein